MVKTYWFYERSFFSFCSSILLLLGMGGLLFSLLDIRGQEEKIKTQVPVDRTIILIDTSASMLAEDVKPSRLQKAALMAKHFARKAAGHQLSIVAFAEIQKKIVPFTTDVDLIDARLDSIKNLRNQYGSSALSLAIQESIQYFREIGEPRGNILVFTDGEETAEGIDLKVPKEIHVALVGIGSSQGGRIPLDDSNGFRFGYKKDKGQDIITKLNEKFFKEAVADIPSGQYWLANSYSLPSDEIIDFFRSEKSKSDHQQDMVIKPVLMEWIVIPSVLLLILAYVFKAIRIFTIGLLLITFPLYAQDQAPVPELSQETVEKLSQLQNGELNQVEKLKLADELYKGGSKEEAILLYDESLDLKKMDSELPPEAYLNYGTALLEKGKVSEGLDVYQSLSQSLGKDDQSNKIRDMMTKNIASYFQQQEEQKKKQEKEDKEKKEGKKDKNNQGQGSEKGQSEMNDQKEGSKEDKKEEGKGDKEEKKDKKDEGADKDEEKKDMKDQEAEKGQEKKPLPPKKIPAKLKQLMSDDRQLQMKMIENGTRELNKRKSRQSKDW